MQDRQLILLAHGSRDPAWCHTFEKGLQEIKAHLSQPAALAYMEMASPSLESVVRQCYHSGARHLRILPLFFASGRHLLQDVPEKLAMLRSEMPDLQLVQLDAVGEQQGFWVYLSHMIAGREALAEKLGNVPSTCA